MCSNAPVIPSSNTSSARAPRRLPKPARGYTERSGGASDAGDGAAGSGGTAAAVSGGAASAAVRRNVDRRPAVGWRLGRTSGWHWLLRILLLQAGDDRRGDCSQPEYAQRGPGHEPEHRHEVCDADQRHSDQQRARPLPPVLGAVLGDQTAANPAGSGHPADQTGEQQRADHERYHHQPDDRHGQYEEHRPDQQHHQHSAEAGAQRLLRQHVHAGPHRPLEQEIDCQVEQREQRRQPPHPGQARHERAPPQQAFAEPRHDRPEPVPRPDSAHDDDLITAGPETGRGVEVAGDHHQIPFHHRAGFYRRRPEDHHEVALDTGGAGQRDVAHHRDRVAVHFPFDRGRPPDDHHVLDPLTGRHGVVFAQHYDRPVPAP